MLHFCSIVKLRFSFSVNDVHHHHDVFDFFFVKKIERRIRQISMHNQQYTQLASSEADNLHFNIYVESTLLTRDVLVNEAKYLYFYKYMCI